MRDETSLDKSSGLHIQRNGSSVLHGWVHNEVREGAVQLVFVVLNSSRRNTLSKCIVTWPSPPFFKSKILINSKVVIMIKTRLVELRTIHDNKDNYIYNNSLI